MSRERRPDVVVGAAPSASEARLSGIPSVLSCMAYTVDRQGDSGTHTVLLQVVLAVYTPVAGRASEEAGRPEVREAEREAEREMESQ